MLSAQRTHFVLYRKLHISSVISSKISKRRKVKGNILSLCLFLKIQVHKYIYNFQDTKLKHSPNLRDVKSNEKSSGKSPNATKLALDFFDSHYKQTYGTDWHSIRLALFSKPKFAALVNNLSSKEEIIEELKAQGCLSIKDLYNEGKAFIIILSVQIIDRCC